MYYTDANEANEENADCNYDMPDEESLSANHITNSANLSHGTAVGIGLGDGIIENPYYGLEDTEGDEIKPLNAMEAIQNAAIVQQVENPYYEGL